MSHRVVMLWRGLLLREVRENKTLLLYTPAILLVVGSLAALQIVSLFAPEERGGLISLILGGLDGSDAAAFAPLFTTVSGLYLMVMMGGAAFYLAGSLYSDRRDQSYLFWQSMPVSDTQTVIAKLVFALIVVPLAYAFALVLAALLVLLSTALYALSLDIPLQGIAELADFLAASVGLTSLSAMLAMCWLLPGMGWLLLFSAAVPRAPLLWALSTLIALSLLEGVLLGSGAIDAWIGSRSSPWQYLVFDRADAAERLLSYDMLAGFLLGALLVAGAIRARSFAKGAPLRVLAGVVAVVLLLVIAEGRVTQRAVNTLQFANPFFDFDLSEGALSPGGRR